MKNKKTLAIISLVLSILSLSPLVYGFETLSGEEIFLSICIILAIIGVVLGVISRKEVKGLSLAGIIIGIVSCLLLCLSLMGISMYDKLTNCVDNGDETSTCELMGQETQAPNMYLTEDQMKK